jgi:hypothetical protein
MEVLSKDAVAEDMLETFSYDKIIEQICNLKWNGLSKDELTDVAWAYYHFSVQFRESLLTARELFPDDPKLIKLEQEECNTSNLSPWPSVAETGEKMNHDEFMRRLLRLSPIDAYRQRRLEAAGESYLAITREMEPMARALCIASYEAGGLERVFHAFLTAPYWDDVLLQAFSHFLTEHIRFDSDPEQGHGALSRHLSPDDRILPLWQAFKDLLVESVPKLASC